MSKIIVSSEQGTGKTAMAEQLLALYPNHTIVDEWDGMSELPENTIAFTNVDLPIK